MANEAIDEAFRLVRASPEMCTLRQAIFAEKYHAMLHYTADVKRAQEALREKWQELVELGPTNAGE